MTDPPFTCPLCGAVRHSPRDAEERWCGRCFVFADDVTDEMIEAFWFPDPPEALAGG